MIECMKYHSVIVLMIVLLGGIPVAFSLGAEEPFIELHETKEDILKALTSGAPSDSALGTKSFVPRGPERIVPDEYQELVEHPTARSLIVFEYNSDTLKQESLYILRNYGEVLRNELRDAVIVIAGHADAIGSDAYNLDLSRRRAQSAKQFLVEHFAIQPERLVIRFYGERQPIASNETAEGRALNRRVEFVRVQ